MIMDEEKLSDELKKAIIDWFDPDELVMFLGLETEDLVDILEDIILEDIEVIEDEIMWSTDDDEEDDYT